MFEPPNHARRAEEERQKRLAGKPPADAGTVKLWHVLTIVGGTVAAVLIGSLIIEAGYGEQAEAVLCFFARRCS